MRTLIWSVLAVVAAGVVIAELAMDLTWSDRVVLYAVFGAMAVVTSLVAVVALRWAPRMRSVLTSLRIVALAAVVVAGGVVAGAALTMFIEPHDLTVALVALLLGVGLGGVLAVAVAGPLTADLDRLAETARSVGTGDLAVATGISRRDELGTAAAAFDAMTRRLAESEQERESSIEERRTLIASVGHDLRSPLASLQAAVEALQDGIAADPARYLRGMAADVDHLRRLVDDLFLLSQIDAGRHRVDPVPVDLAELADEAVEAMSPVAESLGVRLAVSTDGPVPVLADPAAVGRILRNLVDNAVRHSPEDGTVTVTVGRCEGGGAIEVSDEGPGFPTSFREHAFERFARPDEARSRQQGGAGLGLAIAKELTELSRGKIELGEGSGGRVKFELPGS
ncbi:MAG: HAMP domain-containing sensor histidine kinase [Acidimicrobiia bacterium]